MKSTPMRQSPPKKRRTKSERTKRIELLDTLFSEAIRTRDEHTCQYCGRSTKMAQTHHIFTRTNMSTRFDMENGVCLCFYCHRYQAHGAGEFNYWVSHTWLGLEAYENLHRHTRQTVMVTDAWLDEQEARLRAEIEKLQAVTA